MECELGQTQIDQSDVLDKAFYPWVYIGWRWIKDENGNLVGEYIRRYSNDPDCPKISWSGECIDKLEENLFEEP